MTIQVLAISTLYFIVVLPSVIVELFRAFKLKVNGNDEEGESFIQKEILSERFSGSPCPPPHYRHVPIIDTRAF